MTLNMRGFRKPWNCTFVTDGNYWSSNGTLSKTPWEGIYSFVWFLLELTTTEVDVLWLASACSLSHNAAVVEYHEAAINGACWKRAECDWSLLRIYLTVSWICTALLQINALAVFRKNWLRTRKLNATANLLDYTKHLVTTAKRQAWHT